MDPFEIRAEISSLYPAMSSQALPYGGFEKTRIQQQNVISES
jgi:hypothetical protein